MYEWEVNQDMTEEQSFARRFVQALYFDTDNGTGRGRVDVSTGTFVLSGDGRYNLLEKEFGIKEALSIQEAKKIVQKVPGVLKSGIVRDTFRPEKDYFETHRLLIPSPPLDFLEAARTLDINIGRGHDTATQGIFILGEESIKAVAELGAQFRGSDAYLGGSQRGGRGRR